MTINKLPNQDDVREHSKNIGFSLPMFNSQPDISTIIEQGSGSIGFSQFGCSFSLTSSVDDAVILKTLRRKGNPASYSGLSGIRTDIIYSLHNNSTIDDGSMDGTWLIGWPEYYRTNADAPTLELPKGEYSVGSITAPAQMPTQNELTQLTIIEDYEMGETTFHHRSDSFDETVTLNNYVNTSGSANIRGDSNGVSGDNLLCQYIGVSMETL